MARRCSICEHPRRDEIEDMLIHRPAWGYKRVASWFGVGGTALWRHHRNHMAETRERDELWKDNYPEAFKGTVKRTDPEVIEYRETKRAEAASFLVEDISALLRDGGETTAEAKTETDRLVAALRREDAKLLSLRSLGERPPGIQWPEPITKRHIR